MRRKTDNNAPTYAGFWIRAVARLADDVWLAFLLGNAAFIATFALDAYEDIGGHVLTVITVVASVAHLIYFTVWTAVNGESWGKALAGLRVINGRDRVPTWGQSLVRAVVDTFFLNLPVLGMLDPLWVPFQGEKRSLHDFAGGTRVIRVGPARKRALTVAAVVCIGGQVTLFFAVIRPFVTQAYYVPSESMVPTLLVKDRLLANRLTYRLREPRRGEVILFKAPPAATAEPKDYVKRLVGVPGDTLAVRDGKLFRNGHWVKEPYGPMEDNFPPDYYGEADREVWGERVTVKGVPCVRVPPGHFFVMGDNRNNSYDSRRWGYVPRENLIGKATFRFWPPRRLGKL